MTQRADRLALVACLTAGVIFGLGQALGLVSDPYDARAYWDVNFAHLYLDQWTGGYSYPPPLALALAPFHPLGFGVYIVAFTTATWAAFWYLTRAWAPLVLVAGFAIVPILGGALVGYLFLGNIQLIMAAAIVASIRISPVWAAMPLVTKLVPVSLVWYAVRREWRNLGVALGATVAVVGLSVVVAPDTWTQFARFATTASMSDSALEYVPIAYPVRLVLAVLLMAWAGLTDRRWPVMIAASLAIPALYMWSFLSVWIGVIGIEWPETKKAPAPAEARTGTWVASPPVRRRGAA